MLKDIAVTELDPRRFERLDQDRARQFPYVLRESADRLRGRRLWHINSTEQGGGVAEMLHFLLGYLAGAGIDARWLVIEGDERFFAITKRVHNLLHGQPGDGGTLGERERVAYRRTLDASLAELIPKRIRPGDVVFLHDPQTVGLAPALKRLGASVIWSCHVGTDQANDLARSAWRWLRPDVRHADAYVFSRRAYRWEGLSAGKLAVIPPCIDAFSPKNQVLGQPRVSAILAAAGILDHGGGVTEPEFQRLDGSAARVERRAEMTQEGPIPPSAPIVLQVSRWDRLKDPVGVLQGFAYHVDLALGAHLVLAGPASSAVSDDPEGEEELAKVRGAWRELPRSRRERVHLACLPMDDLEENGAMVNALQRRADVLVQKSLAEGFGLTVAEAMWKGRPVVGSSVGGIQDQITHGASGLLLDDPRDLPAFGGAVQELLRDRRRAQQIGERAHRHVRERYLAPHRLGQEMELVDRLVS